MSPTETGYTGTPESPVLRAASAIRGSFLLSMILIGVLCVVIGVVLDGVVAGMFGIWGVSIIVPSSVAYAIVRHKRQY